MRKSISKETGLSDMEIELIGTFRAFENIIKYLQEMDVLYYPSNPDDTIPDNGVIHLNTAKALMVQGKEITGRDKIIGLLALAKQKQNDGDTQIDDAILNLYCVVHKNTSMVQVINNRLNKKGYQSMPPEFPGFNRIILLEVAMNEWKRIRTTISEQESAILSGLIALYAHLNKFRPWLLTDEEQEENFTWDDWIRLHVQESAGFQLGDVEVIKTEIVENNITQATTRIIEGLKIIE